MSNTIVLGMQWGDEGKGKIVDLICPAFDAVVRFQGGHNAGHTVKFGDQHFALHLLPSGIVHGGKRCVLGNGMVIYPEALFKEIDAVGKAGVDVAGRLFVSSRAQVILPLHSALDQAREAARGKGKIGTTSRGIGPAYEARAARTGLRIGDLVGKDIERLLEAEYRRIVPQLRDLGAEDPASITEVAAQCAAWGERLAPWIADTGTMLNRWIDDGQSLLFEGAQGALLDVDHGTYPYVTSSNATAGGACTGSGVPPTRIDGMLGVVKAYTTRVGSGPFVTELEDDTGQHLRERGNEFGTTTGRPRRCGWFDAVAVRHACRLNGVDGLAVTKLDVLDEVDEILVCTAYRIDGEEVRDFPASIEQLERAEPVYRSLPGWKTSTVSILEQGDLPQTAQDYLAVIEEECGAPSAMISTGPRREETILCDRPETRRLLSEGFDEIVAHRNGA